MLTDTIRRCLAELVDTAGALDDLLDGPAAQLPVLDLAKALVKVDRMADAIARLHDQVLFSIDPQARAMDIPSIPRSGVEPAELD